MNSDQKFFLYAVGMAALAATIGVMMAMGEPEPGRKGTSQPRVVPVNVPGLGTILMPVNSASSREDTKVHLTEKPQLFWAPDPGSPLILLSVDEAIKYVPTRENLVEWVESVKELSDVDTENLEWTNDLRYLWGTCLQEQALRSYIIGHAAREQERWWTRGASVSLESELQPVRQFMNRHLGDDQEVWELINKFSDEVAAKIRGEGEEAGDRDEASKWALHRALTQAGLPSFEAVVDTIRKN